MSSNQIQLKLYTNIIYICNYINVKLLICIAIYFLLSPDVERAIIKLTNMIHILLIASRCIDNRTHCDFVTGMFI